MINSTKILSLAVALTATSYCANAQNLMLFEDYDGNAIANGDLLTYEDAASAAVIESSVKCALNASSPKDVNLKRYETTLLSGTGNYFCWGLCYLEQPAGSRPLWDSNDPLNNMTPNVFTSNFHAYFTPNNLVGSMQFRYVWYDVNNPADSSWLDIEFNSLTVGINELNTPVVDFSVYPNPVDGDNATAQLELLDQSDAQIVMHNVLGEEILRETASGITSTVNLNLDGVDGGVYFVSVQVSGELLRTERLVVR